MAVIRDHIVTLPGTQLEVSATDQGDSTDITFFQQDKDDIVVDLTDLLEALEFVTGKMVSRR
jgi:hypothetical protein